MRFGIRYRLMVPLGLLLVGVVGTSLLSARLAAHREEERVATQVRNVSKTLSNANFPLTGPVLEQMKSLSGAEFLLVSPEGSKLTTLGEEKIDVPSDDIFEGFDDQGIGPIVREHGTEFRCHRLLLKEPHRQAGGVVYIFYPEALLEEAIADAKRPSFIGLLFGLIAVVLTYGIGQRLVGRIRELEKRTRQIAAGDFSPMPLPKANDELRDLSASVNEMAERLDRLNRAAASAERSRLTAQLSTGLAHQLRNGVTGAKLAVQVFLSENADQDTEALQVALRQLATMEANLRRFIDLERSSDVKREACWLNRILKDVVELIRPRCKHAGIGLHCDLPANEVRIQGDSGQIGDIFSNLIGNAVDAVGSEGSVQVTLTSEASHAVVEVSDTGPGPTAELAARLFEPFVTGKPEGIGLGLAVAKHAVEAHGGTISWHRDGGRTVFRVTLSCE